MTPWSVTRQTPLSMGFSRQEYWSELPFPPPGDLPDPGIKPGLLHWRRLFFFFFNHWTTRGSPKGFHRQWHFQNLVEKTVRLRLSLSWEPSAHLNPYTDNFSHAGCACLGGFGAVRAMTEQLNLVMRWSLFPRRAHSPGSLGWQWGP